MVFAHGVFRASFLRARVMVMTIPADDHRRLPMVSWYFFWDVIFFRCCVPHPPAVCFSW